MVIKTIGLVIFVLGFILALYTGFDFVTKEKVPDRPSIQITKDDEPATNWSPLIGIGAMVIGGIVFVLGRKNHFRLSAN